ncbi:phosphoribosylformylglycinamidine synthase subunit PurQ [Alkalilacustris brevis]|uniref:phosphoribosylformylglycinamidine synthase subunit PurQ n=1 Tax=Alkalilacustris brevis TaxID=2026338 RepID=UPI000E0D010F|nr:phosphoribosylformylglycinamidine synthase subunit PurQ [Alkalilacustris brevis]
MKAAVITFPGSNCDRDLAVAFEGAGAQVVRVWHKDTELPAGVDIVGLPGGFSFGDYLRCGAIAARAPIFSAVAGFAARGGHVLGICNGFQVLCESGLLPGTLMRNASLRFVCRNVALRVETADSAFTAGWKAGQGVTFPVAHHDGNYAATPEVLERLRAEDRVAFRYLDNPNGSMDDIAGILSQNRRVLGMMPHPERAVDAAQGGRDGSVMFRALVDAMVNA